MAKPTHWIPLVRIRDGKEQLHPDLRAIPNGASGVYAIKEWGGKVWYVGFSQGGGGGLRKRLLRHVQASNKKVWTIEQEGLKRTRIRIRWCLLRAELCPLAESAWAMRYQPAGVEEVMVRKVGKIDPSSRLDRFKARRAAGKQLDAVPF